eukprot:TRINITY_DN9724_c0_g1_i1.p1 TRINITY_DN9724_c0_g1~~TRINITY_DN9724_c0_g1_i1.p1  ORF type:complete len:491 (+),score=77.48 TRINITY_DN9724_c0_g1_i1:37-1509(+)
MSFTSTVEHRAIKTHIVCTIGPDTKAVEKLLELKRAGMSVARMNFSHGSHPFHQSIIENVREAVSIDGIYCALMLDTKGPEIRTGKLLGDKKSVTLTKGTKFLFTNDQSVLGDETKVNTTYEKLPKTVKPGDTILVDDGLISFKVEKCIDGEVYTEVLNTGNLGNIKGVNLPGVVVDLPAVTEKDKEDIAFGVRMGVDFIAASFIRTAANVDEIRNLPGVADAGIKIISKIESEEGLDNFTAILKVSDGIMVARGDLGVEIPIEKVANAQKMMIRECNYAGKPVITATQMLDSMINFPRPTRAEATDVSNAVFDGTDCVMLSGETASGKYPVEAVKTMHRICLETERVIEYRTLYTSLRKRILAKQNGNISVSESICSSAVKTSWDLRASLIVVISESGNTVRFVSKYRPHCPILCVTCLPLTARQVLISRSAFPLLVDSMLGTEQLIQKAIAYAKSLGLVKAGELVVTTSGVIEGTSGSTNLLKVSKAN